MTESAGILENLIPGQKGPLRISHRALTGWTRNGDYIFFTHDFVLLWVVRGTDVFVFAGLKLRFYWTGTFAINVGKAESIINGLVGTGRVPRKKYMEAGLRRGDHGRIDGISFGDAMQKR